MSRANIHILPIDLLGHCCLFLNLKEIHATHAVSHIFQQATRSEEAWNENATLPSFHHSAFPSPRIQLRSATPAMELATIRSSPPSIGHSARWLEVTGEVCELKEMVQLIEQESNKLDGLIIRELSRNVKMLAVPPLSTFNHSSTHLSSLRALVIGGVYEALMTSLLPTIATIHSLEILEFGLSGIDDAKRIMNYSLPTTFATSLCQLTKLSTLILSDLAYRRMVNNQRYPVVQLTLMLSNTSLGMLQVLVASAPQITRIELCCVLECSLGLVLPAQLPVIQLPQVRTLAINSSGITDELRQKLFHLFSNIHHLMSLNLLGQSSFSVTANFFEALPSTIRELTIGELKLQPAQTITTTTPISSLHKMTIHHLSPLTLKSDDFTQFLHSVFGQIKEFHVLIIGSLKDHLDLFQFMPNLRVTTLHWRADFENNSNRVNEWLPKRLPRVTHLRIIKPRQGEFRSAYEARELLRTIPLLKEVKWGNQPWLSLNQIESYYSWESIDQRLKQPLNLDRLDQIQPILQQINSSSLPNTIALNLLSLTLIFQFLTPMDLFSAHRVCRSYRVAAVSPLVLRPNIRVRIDDEKGVVVSGTQVSFTAIKPMLSAVRSMLFQNIRILTLPPPLGSHLEALPRQPDFYHCHLNRFELIPYFHSLHTLSLDWNSKSNYFVAPSDSDQVMIDHVLQSSALKHLKVIRLLMSPILLELILNKCVSFLNGLEMVELKVSQSVDVSGPVTPISFSQLAKLKHLKEACIDPGYATTTLSDLTQLAALMEASDSIESIVWVPRIDPPLLQELCTLPLEQLPQLSRIHSLIVYPGDTPSSLTTVLSIFPSLTHLQLHWSKHNPPPNPTTFPIQLAQQLVSLVIYTSNEPHTLMVMETLCASVSSCAGAWSRLVRFVLFNLMGYDKILQNDDDYRRPISSPDSLMPFLNSATHLTDLSLEGMKFQPRYLEPHLAPQPWISRLRIFQLSDSPSLLRLLPHARSLVEFRTSLSLTGTRLSATLLTLPHLQSATFDTTSMTRTQLRQYQNQRSAIQIIPRPERPSLTTPTPAPAPAPAPPADTNQSLTQRISGSSTTTDTILSGVGETAPASTNGQSSNSTTLRTILTHIAIGATDATPTPSSITTTVPSSSTLEIDSLSEIFMELVQSFQHTNGR